MGRTLTIVRWLPFVVLALLALAHEPRSSGFATDFQGCALIPTGAQFQATFTNVRHLGSFFVLCLLAALAFRPFSWRKAAVATFALSVLIEIEQAIFVEGHCRAWDLIPNLIGVAAGAVVAVLAVAAWRRFRPARQA